MGNAYRNSYKKEDWQQAQFELLLKFDRFCQDHDITYSLDFGSMLGAIRHRGYIPWDNDVDVCLMQSEYDKLLHVVREGEIPEGCALIDRSLNPDHQQAFGRLVDTTTSCMLERTAWINPTNGLFVDIFALRPLPTGERAKHKAIRDFCAYDEYLSIVKRRAGNRTWSFKVRYAQLLLREKLFGRENATSWIKGKADRALSEENPEWLLINSGGWYDGFELRRPSWVSEVERVPVNGHMLPVFKGYLEILRVDYGDGWRNWPDGALKFQPYVANLNIPGEFIFRDYTQAIDRQKAVKTLHRETRLGIADMFIRGFYSPEAYRAKGILSLTRIKSELDDQVDIVAFPNRHAEAGDKILEDARKVAKAFESYLNVQTGERYTYWNAAIPLDASWLASALWALIIAREDYWTAAKILKINHADRKGRKLIKRSNEVKEAEQAIKLISDMHLNMDRGDDESVSLILSQLDALCPECHDRRIGTVWLASRRNPAEIESERIQRDLSLCRECGEYLAYYATALENLGRTDEARDLREEALGKTRNGMVILEIKDKLSENA